jgi:hypothetical protein
MLTSIRYGLVARISRSHTVQKNNKVRGGRGSIPRVGNILLPHTRDQKRSVVVVDACEKLFFLAAKKKLCHTHPFESRRWRRLLHFIISTTQSSLLFICLCFVCSIALSSYIVTSSQHIVIRSETSHLSHVVVVEDHRLLESQHMLTKNRTGELWKIITTCILQAIFLTQKPEICLCNLGA